MKIGHKIAIFYTTITVLIITVVVIIFYLFISHYIDKVYDSYLMEKASLTAQKNWEKDEVDAQSYQVISQKYDELLPHAKQVLFNADSLSYIKDSLKSYLNDEQVNNLLSGSKIYFNYHNQSGVAIDYIDNQGHFIVIVLSHNKYGENIQDHILTLMIILLFFSSILIYITGRIYASRIMAPLHHILKELKRIRGNNLHVRINTSHNHDELDELITVLNDMLDRIDTAFQSEKSFISNASHELNNPITAIQGECEISLLKERSVVEYQQALQRIFSESKRISMLTKNLLFLSHQDEELLKNSSESINLGDFLNRIIIGNARVNASIDNTQSSQYLIHANPYLLRIAIQNIIDNACKYSTEIVQLRLFTSDGKINIEVEDYGIGIPETEVNKIFQSFYRATNTRAYSGNGIGLSLSFKIVSIYNGNLEISSKLGEGTKIKIIFS